MDRQEFNLLCNRPANNYFGGNQKENHQWWCQQHIEEFWDLLSLCSGATTVIEIGVNHGGTLVFWDHLVGTSGTCIGIDLNEETYLFSMFNEKYCKYKPLSKLVCLQKSSHDIDTLKLVSDELNGFGADVLFIDGDHSYEGCLEDFNMYSPLVKKGGIIVFHDIIIEPRVRRVFDGIPGDKQTISYTNGPGIGVLRV